MAFIITFKLFDGDLSKKADPSVNDVIRTTLSMSPARAGGLKPVPTSCRTFAASVMMTYKILIMKIFILSFILWSYPPSNVKM